MTFWLSASSNSNLMRFHTMENVSAFPTATKQRIPTTLSAASLEVGQIITANFVQNSSLLSESVTHVSDLSSTFSEVLPAFPMCSLPDVATVSLGEHLKMFPGTPTTTNSCILLASPTAPRLQSMCKECLSISKWAVRVLVMSFMEPLTGFLLTFRNILWAGVHPDTFPGKTRWNAPPRSGFQRDPYFRRKAFRAPYFTLGIGVQQVFYRIPLVRTKWRMSILKCSK